MIIIIKCVPNPRCRYLEVRYHRPEEIHKGRLIESRVENTIVYMPDIAAACMPSSIEWEQTIPMYKQACDEEIAEELNEDNTPVHIIFVDLFFSFFSFLAIKTTISLQSLKFSISVFLPFSSSFFSIHLEYE